LCGPAVLADEGEPQVATAPSVPHSASSSASRAPSSAWPRAHAPGQGMDLTMRRMSRDLDLDTVQQTQLRALLLDQQQQIRRFIASSPAGQNDRVGGVLAIIDQTREKIRAMLNAEQLKKYPASVPRDQTAASQVDVDQWMQLTRPPVTDPKASGKSDSSNQFPATATGL
jgi:Spy/CpxP family protein refolding chaperone